MALRHDVVGTVTGPWDRTWSSTDSLLYAVAVGAGQDDPLRELPFTTENSAEIAQQAIPSLAIVLAQFDGPPNTALEGVDFTKLLHAEQALTLHRPLPAEGRISLRSEVTGLYDKTKGALLETSFTASDERGDDLFTTRTSVFIRGEGGWGGDRGANPDSPVPERAPDAEVSFRTAVNQALIYRLTGDRNPLHSDPTFAKAAGFDRPILHGLATYGITTRLLVGEVCGGDASRLRHIEGRFTKPVFPGQDLTVRTWSTGDGTAFQTVNEDGDVVIDRGLVKHS
ncbi:MaoC family dehydratase [Sciscionella sediminilitoris]|uniref:MaoC family dehydratase n=1 Tax=Sciscionella sediminilitoris TaxID=1445613 RepID=UPI0004DF5F04|nr:MaoC family dehydratase [Sciscionella sp. SE31]